MIAPGRPPVREGDPTGVRRRRSLATQATVAMVAVAAIAVGLTGVIAEHLVRDAAQRQAFDSLSRQAQIVARVVADRRPSVLLEPRLLPAHGYFVSQRIQIATVTPDGTVRGPGRTALLSGDRSALRAGHGVQGVRTLRGRSVLMVGRPLPIGGAVVLVEPASVARGVTSDASRRILAALLVGLVGAAIAGFLLSRRLARPLQRAALAAHEMARGARDVRLPEQGPAEVAELANALTRLSGALARSEGRQREFLLSVSHELRTPLTAVKGFAEALADGVLPADDVRATGSTMLAEATRLDRLVADLLDLARLGAEDFRLDLAETDLRALVVAAAEVWQARCAREGLELRTELPDGPVPVVTDAGRVRQALDGLAENALRVVPPGGPVVFALRARGAVASLEVRDGGPGLTEDDLRVAFERSALHDRYRGVRRVGTGVGLALVSGLVARLGGRTEAGHAPEGGARFTIVLPLGVPGASDSAG